MKTSRSACNQAETGVSIEPFQGPFTMLREIALPRNTQLLVGFLHLGTEEQGVEGNDK